MFGWEFGKGDGGISGVRGFCVGCIVCKTIHLVAYCFVFFWRSLGLKVYE